MCLRVKGNKKYWLLEMTFGVDLTSFVGAW